MNIRTLLILITTLAMTASLALAQDSACTCVDCECAAVASTLTVSARGSVEVDPDRAVVSVGVVKQAETAKEAMSAVNEKLTEARDRIRKLDIRGTQLSTSNISVYPVYENVDNRNRSGTNVRRIVGYRASNTLNVRIDDIERTGEAIDEAFKAGVNQMQGVTFTTRDPFASQTEALAQATMRARTKANVMAGAMDAKVSRVVRANESGASSPPPSPMRGRAMMESAMADFSPTPVEAGSLTVSAGVTIVFELSFENNE